MKGVEPPRRRRQILSLVRLPIPPHPQLYLMVEDGGFEPPKAMLTDLQSAPFGRSGKSSVLYMELVIGIEPTTC